MSYRATQIINKPLYSLHTHTLIGYVTDIAYNPKTRQVEGIMMREDNTVHNTFVKWKLLRQVTQDALWIDSEADVKLASKLLKPYSVLLYNAATGYKPVFYESSSRLGYLSDLIFELGQKKIPSIEIIAGETTNDRWIIPIEKVRSLRTNSVYIDTLFASEIIGKIKTKGTKTKELRSSRNNIIQSMKKKFDSILHQIT